ncbi:hypothetical protein [Algoriphagus aquimarinus]|uniref:GLPGLI family protein n=1 Tax=Algoriphagus aquimarinus TaxID=237018 RepID=A0A5C7AR20_9BACT|nr:hypothetical protein [Algoriphagus aquimarinus]TXE11196.1 hypothetical protein ESV85_11660 [Algoriphagus aquimarinus]
MKNYLLILAFFFCTMVQGQIVTSKNVSDNSYGEKKLKDAPKKVYLNQFFVNYQLIAASSEASAGGKTKAEMAVGMTGVEIADMQEITNNAYAMVVKKLQDAGIEIVNSAEAGNTEFYSDWTKMTGGTPSKAQLIGYVSTAPAGFDFYVKKVDSKGKTKGTFLDTTPKLSKELGDIPVFEANICFQFVTIEGNSSYVTDATKMKGVVQYQMPEVAIAKSAEGIFGSKIETSRVAARVVWKGGMNGAGANTILSYSPKGGIEIPGVMEEKKFKEYVTPDRSYNTTYAGVAYTNDKELEVSHQVKADRAAYKTKTQQALNEYLSLVVDNFIASLN